MSAAVWPALGATALQQTLARDFLENNRGGKRLASGSMSVEEDKEMEQLMAGLRGKRQLMRQVPLRTSLPYAYGF